MSQRTEKNIQILAGIFPEIQRFFHNVSIQVSKTGEFTLAQYRVLSLLEHFEKMTVNDLKNHLNMAQSSASGLVERLEQLGLIKKKTDARDKRVTELTLTAKAKRILRKRADSMVGVYRKILGPLSYKDQKLFLDSFENLKNLIKKIESGK